MRGLGRKTMDYVPRGDRVIVKRSERPARKPEDVFIPDSQQKPLNSGIVIAVGPGAKNPITGKIDPIEDLEPGDSVDFLDYAGSEIEVDGEPYLLMRESEIHLIRRPAR
jgi:chaperonin GroES